jgi:hypothetical protein
MNRYFVLLLFILFGFSVKAQVLTTTFIDPCTKEVKLIVVPLIGSTVISLYNESKSFTAADVQSGALNQWISQVYIKWSTVNPCSTNQASTTATQVAANTVSSVVSSAVSIPPPPVATPTPTASSSGSSTSGESSSSSSSSESSSSESSSSGESKEESKSESKSESKGKGGSKAARMNPMLLSSDLTIAQNLDLSVNAIVSTGMSQSSMAGDKSYGATAMIWSNLKQFAFNARYTKMGFKDGQLKYINNFSYTWAYSYGTKMGVLGFAHIKPLNKWGIAGVNISQITIGLPYQLGFFDDTVPIMVTQYGFLFSVTAFYTKPISLNKRWNISPELYVTCNPYMFLNRQHLLIKDYTLNMLSGVSGDFSITKRFKLNVATKTSFSTNNQIPILLNFLIGSKINL